jgi:hypothetical protein
MICRSDTRGKVLIVDDARTTGQKIDDWQKPRNTTFDEKPGEYRLAIRALQADINPGDEFRLDIYITGYGEIRGPKVTFYPPPYFVQTDKSKVTHDLKVDTNENKVSFGAQEDMLTSQHMDEYGTCCLVLIGYKAKNWGYATPFFDYSGRADGTIRAPMSQELDVYPLATEWSVNGRAPIELHLKTKSRIPSGNYILHFCLTYFNGEEWKVDKQSISLAVPNWFKRHEWATWTAGVAGVLLALVGLFLGG